MRGLWFDLYRNYSDEYILDFFIPGFNGACNCAGDLGHCMVHDNTGCAGAIEQKCHFNFWIGDCSGP